MRIAQIIQISHLWEKVPLPESNCQTTALQKAAQNLATGLLTKEL